MTNTPGYNRFRFQLKDEVTKQSIIKSGGSCFVTIAGSSQKETLTDKNGVALTNPLQLTAGFIDCCVNVAHLTVDMYIMCPGGQFVVLKGIAPSGLDEYEVPTNQKRQTMVIPFNIADCTAGTEFDTGFALPAQCRVLNRLHGAGLLVTTAETAGAKTILVGTLSTNSGGSASEFINGSSTATLGQVTGTDGAGFSTNAPYLSDANPAALELSYTLVTASVAAAGFIVLPYQLN